MGGRRRRARWSAALALLACAASADDNPYLPVAGNAAFQSSLQDRVSIPDFLMQRHPVTNGEFQHFVLAHPEWRRGAAPALLVGQDYLSQWREPLEPGPAQVERQPVTRVSWFAAEAYCESGDARLPTWYEWELAAAASDTQLDARGDPAWRQRILDWYSRPAGGEPPAVEQSPADIRGLRDLHGLVWEWVQDANSLMSADEAAKFCGSGALNMKQKENFAVLMRVATLSTLHAADSMHSLGFRCVREPAGARR